MRFAGDEVIQFRFGWIDTGNAAAETQTPHSRIKGKPEVIRKRTVDRIGFSQRNVTLSRSPIKPVDPAFVVVAGTKNLPSPVSIRQG